MHRILSMAIKSSNQVLLNFSFFLLLIGRLSYSQTDKLLPGQVLKDGDELYSAFGSFRLGFFSPDGTAKRYLGIWYHKPTNRMDQYNCLLGGLYSSYSIFMNSRFDCRIEDRYNYRFEGKIQPVCVADRRDPRTLGIPGTFGIQNRIQPVWVGNRNDPILDKSGRLTIDRTDGKLKILRDSGDPIVISSIQAAGNNTSATLEKSGNFVLYEMNSNESVRLWQSFDYPTDTLLPGMKLGINLQTGHKWFLQSWITETSPANGSYTLGIDPNVAKNLVIWSAGKVNWTSGLWMDGSFNSSLSSAAGFYNFSYSSNGQEVYFNYTVNEDVTSFPALKIDQNGELRTEDIRIPAITCTVFGGCTTDETQPSMCNSPSDFQLKYGFMSAHGFKFKGGDNVTSKDCEARCLTDCSCVAYANTNKYNNTGCKIWSRGAKFTESYRGDYRPIYVITEPKEKEKKWWTPQLIIGIVVAVVVPLLFYLCYRIRRKYKAKEEKWWQSLGVVSVIPLLCYLCYLMLRKLKTKVESTWNRWKLLRELGDNISVSLPTTFRKRKVQEKDQKNELKIFDYQIIATATNNFSTTNKLGQGGFGPVYKGKLPDGQEIAIKKLSKGSGQGRVEFKNEAKLIAKLQHTNLVKLVGCSLHGGERILVYEYLSNKSLDFFLFDSSRKNLLNLKKRLSIIEGIAQGLIYLHKYSRLKVIHRDLKVSNILLDDQMNPKISDFGMARAFGVNELEANTNRIVGTHGYMAPEYVMNGIVSMKADVYSFGVMVLEIVSGKKNNGSYDTERPLNLVGYAWQLWNEGKGLELIDQTTDESCSESEVLRYLHVGLLCVQDRAMDRPTMSEVVSMLTNETMILPSPKQPAFFINITSEEPAVPENKFKNCSATNLTISEMQGR